jgi:predicted transcriptional regulator
MSTNETFTMWLDSKLQNLELTRTNFAKIARVGYQTLHPWRLRDFDPRMITFIKVVAAVAKLTDQQFHVVLFEAIQTTHAYKTTMNEVTTDAKH